MKTLFITKKIEAPEGYEIDKEKSTLEQIVFKKIEKRFPLSVDDIPTRNWYIGSSGAVTLCPDNRNFKNDLSTKERAEAFLALMQLVELRDAWNEGWKPDWNDKFTKKYCISFAFNKLKLSYFYADNFILSFKKEDLRDKFLYQFRDLIETAKELL